jgi:hypothetical protein
VRSYQAPHVMLVLVPSTTRTPAAAQPQQPDGVILGLVPSIQRAAYCAAIDVRTLQLSLFQIHALSDLARQMLEF